MSTILQDRPTTVAPTEKTNTPATRQAQVEAQVQAQVQAQLPQVTDWAPWKSIAAHSDTLVQRMSLYLHGRTLPTGLHGTVLRAVEAVKSNDPSLEREYRAKVAYFLLASSQEFVQTHHTTL